MEPRKMVIALPKCYWTELETCANSNGMTIDEVIYGIIFSTIEEWLDLEEELELLQLAEGLKSNVA